MVAFSFFGIDTPLLSFNSIPLIGMIGASLLYLRACSVLAGRGRVVPMAQRVSFFFGLAMIFVATETFVDPVGEEALLSLHMLQHLLIADLPAPFLLYGVRAPLLYFFWPRPILVTVARITPLRRLWSWLTQPKVALTVWLATLYAWHVPFMYEAAISNRIVHDLEHVSFAFTGVLAWWPLMDPTHHRVEGRVWKAAYIVAARMVGGVLGIILVGWPEQVYSIYGDAALRYGIDPLVDQQAAGGMMMIVDSLIIIGAATYFLATIERGSEHDNDLLQPEVAAAIARAKAAQGSADTAADATDGDRVVGPVR